jgi:hypothetical protein
VGLLQPPGVFCFVFVFLMGFVLAKQVLYHLSHTSGAFFSGYFGDEVLRTICLSWP